MMNIGITIAILIVNVLAIFIVYQFIKKLPKKEILVFLAINIAIIYITISIVYWFSGFGIEENVHENSKSYVTYLFVPVNTILFIPFIASRYNKLKNKDIKQEKFIKNVMVVFTIMIIVLVIEFFYFKDIQKNIDKMAFYNSINNTENKDSIIVDQELANEILDQIIKENKNKQNTNNLTNEITNETSIENNVKETVNEII